MHLPTLAARSARLARPAVTLAFLVVLSACGGGGGASTTSSAPSSTSPTTAASLTEGTISGFGSVIVGGVRFDDSAAKVSDDDGGTKTKDDLRLGMTVSIDSSSVSNSTAAASSIEVHSEIAGPVESVNLLGNSLVVLGQSVTVDGTTVYDESLSGLSSITVGMVLEVYARYDAASATYAASRIEKRGNSNEYKLRGVIGNLNTASKRFNINGALIDYSAAKEVPTSLANGQYVKVKLLTTQLAGAWSATKVQNGRSTEDNHSEAEIKGSITAFTSTTQFSVNGLPVDASKASFPKGTTGIVLGAFVEVAGAVTNGVLVATKVAPEDDVDGDGDDDKGSGADDSLDVELHGTLSALDTTAKTFVVRGVKVNYAKAQFQNGSASNLANNASVEVKGALASDGSSVDAATVKFEK